MADNGNGQATVQEATKALSAEALAHTVQVLPQGRDASQAAFGEFLTLYLSREADAIPAWGTLWARRDVMLREIAATEPTLAGALATIASRNATMTFRLDGPPRTIDAVQQMFHEADNGAGLLSWITKLSFDLYNQDNGAFPEWIRSDYITGEEALKRWQSGKPMPPVVGLGHLDAAACTRTGNPLYPVLYRDPDAVGGEPHLLPWHVVSPLAEMPSPDKRQRGRQYSAVTRVLKAAQFARDVEIHRSEKVGGRNPAQISFVGGPSNQAVKDALADAQEHASNQGYIRYMEPLIIASLDPTKPVSVATLEWASLPANFNWDDELRNYITLLALCLGEDYLAFAPLPGGNQGTATQSVMLERKSRGKGAGLWQKLLTHVMNFSGVLPRNVTFEFEERDVEGEIKEAELAQAQAGALKTMLDSGLVTVPVAQQIAADYQMVWFDDDVLEMLNVADATSTETVTDEEPAEATPAEVVPEAAPVPATPTVPAPTAPVPQQAARAPSLFSKALARLWVNLRRSQLRYYKADNAGNIGQVVADFSAVVEDALSGYMEKRYARSRAQRMFEAAIKEAWLPAGELGYADGGGDAADLGDGDYAEMRAAEGEQVQFARDFWAALPEIRKDGGDPLPRGELYAGSLKAFYTDWKGRGAGNPSLEWRLGKTEQHCDTCKGLHKTRHTLKWYKDHDYIPRKPGAGMDCHGYKCDCAWLTRDGKEFTL